MEEQSRKFLDIILEGSDFMDNRENAYPFLSYLKMQFSEATTNPFYDNYNYSNRFESESKQWQIFLHPVLYGVRVCVGENNKSVFVLDICCGAERSDIIEVFLTIKYWLSQFPESISFEEIKSSFPNFEIKPVTKDPNWNKFVKKVFNSQSSQSIAIY